MGKLVLTTYASCSEKKTKHNDIDQLPAPSRRLLSILNSGMAALDMFEDKTENRPYQLTHDKLSDMHMSGVELMLRAIPVACCCLHQAKRF